jgi:hypothetical protein
MTRWTCSGQHRSHTSSLRKTCRKPLADALAAPGLKELMNQAVEARRQKLVQRQSEIARMASQWAAGMDDVRVASVDLLTPDPTHSAWLRHSNSSTFPVG